MQPAHPEDSSYARAAAALAHDFTVTPNVDRRSPRPSSEADVLVIAHPSDPRWESTTNGGSPRLSDDELDAIDEFVRAGGLIVLGETEQDKYGNNVNDLLARFGVRVENGTVQDYEHHHNAPSWVLAELDRGQNGDADVDLLARDHRACFYRAGTLALTNGARVLARTSTPPALPAHPSPPSPGTATGTSPSSPTPTCSATTASASSTTRPVAQPRVLGRAASVPRRRLPPRLAPSPTPPGPTSSKPSRSCARWRRRLDRPLEARHRPRRALTRTIADAAQRLAPHFPPGRLHPRALGDDLRAWANAGFTKPDFMRSTEAFRPERHRRDGIEHLAVFPMYKQNASRDTCFEALIVRTLARVRRRARAQPATTTPSTSPSPSSTTPAGTTPSAPSSSPRPSPPNARRATSARSSATARRSACGASRAARRDPPSTCPGRRLPARLARAVAQRVHRLGPDPRPHAHARRPPSTRS